MTFHVPEKFRVKNKHLGGQHSDGNNGRFIIQSLKLKRPLFVQASDGLGWEHVSVSLPDRIPTWEEMVFVRDLFWDPEDLVVQYHPPKSRRVNLNTNVLHLWRKAGTNEFCEMPEERLV